MAQLIRREFGGPIQMILLTIGSGWHAHADTSMGGTLRHPLKCHRKREVPTRPALHSFSGVSFSSLPLSVNNTATISISV